LARPKIKVVIRHGLGTKQLICRAEFAASTDNRPHSTATAARPGREGVRHIRD
jgi:hypothetical protein